MTTSLSVHWAEPEDPQIFIDAAMVFLNAVWTFAAGVGALPAGVGDAEGFLGVGVGVGVGRAAEAPLPACAKLSAGQVEPQLALPLVLASCPWAGLTREFAGRVEVAANTMPVLLPLRRFLLMMFSIPARFPVCTAVAGEHCILMHVPLLHLVKPEVALQLLYGTPVPMETSVTT